MHHCSLSEVFSVWLKNVLKQNCWCFASGAVYPGSSGGDDDAASDAGSNADEGLGEGLKPPEMIPGYEQV